MGQPLSAHEVLACEIGGKGPARLPLKPEY